MKTLHKYMLYIIMILTQLELVQTMPKHGFYETNKIVVT
jgi:hypothetical protein